MRNVGKCVGMCSCIMIMGLALTAPESAVPGVVVVMAGNSPDGKGQIPSSRNIPSQT